MLKKLMIILSVLFMTPLVCFAEEVIVSIESDGTAHIRIEIYTFKMQYGSLQKIHRIYQRIYYDPKKINCNKSNCMNERMWIETFELRNEDYLFAEIERTKKDPNGYVGISVDFGNGYTVFDASNHRASIYLSINR